MVLASKLVGRFVCVGDDRGDRLVDVVLFCCGDIFEEDLCWEPRLGVLWTWKRSDAKEEFSPEGRW